MLKNSTVKAETKPIVQEDFIMSTKAYYSRNEIGPGKVGFSKTRSIIEAPFYGNNVIKVNTLREAYELAKNAPGTVVTDMPVYRTAWPRAD